MIKKAVLMMLFNQVLIKFKDKGNKLLTTANQEITNPVPKVPWTYLRSLNHLPQTRKVVMLRGWLKQSRNFMKTLSPSQTRALSMEM